VSDTLDDFEDFSARVRRRLESGRIEYGDQSFKADSLVLLDEIEQELLDINGWSYVLFARIRKLRRSLLRAEISAKPLHEPDLSMCSYCSGPADNGHDREVPPNPYLCQDCEYLMRNG
jgi:hypothetical protein